VTIWNGNGASTGGFGQVDHWVVDSALPRSALVGLPIGQSEEAVMNDKAAPTNDRRPARRGGGPATSAPIGVQFKL
jgi:hypothetical protein